MRIREPHNLTGMESEIWTDQFLALIHILACSVIDIGGVRAIVEGVRKVLQITAEGGIKWADIRVILIFAVYLFLFWMAVIFIGFFSVILARTCLLYTSRCV